MEKNTKIVCTIGPASESVDTLVQLIEAGMNVARLNFSHGDHDEHLARINNIREASEKTGRRVAILLDTKGPEIRTNNMKDHKPVTLVKGSEVRVSMTEVEGDEKKFSITYTELINDVEKGSHILIDDGLVDLLVTDIDTANNEIVTEVQNTGIIKDKKGVNVPGVSVQLPGITEKDANDIRFGLENDIDYIAASFVRKPSDVLEIREILEETGNESVQIIPKIENQEGVDNLDDILSVSDGLMVARGDLGVEIPAEQVPIALVSEGRKEAKTDIGSLKPSTEGDMAEAISQSVAYTARSLRVSTIVAATESGHTAKMISKYRPSAKIIALTFSESQARKLVLAWGVAPFVVEKPASTDEMMSLAGTVAKESGYAHDGDTIIISAGVPVGEKGTTNLMKIQVIGEKLVSGSGIGEKSVVGHAVVVDNAADAVANVKANSVLVVKSTDNDYNEAIKNAAAVVVEKGGLTSHAAVLGVENGIPVVVGAENATSSIENGQLVTVDARRGIVYNGATTTI